MKLFFAFSFLFALILIGGMQHLLAGSETTPVRHPGSCGNPDCFFDESRFCTSEELKTIPNEAICELCQKKKPVATACKDPKGRICLFCSDCVNFILCEFCTDFSEWVHGGPDKHVYLCPCCSKDAVNRKDEATKIIKDVRQVLSAKFNMKTNSKIDYLLKEPGEMIEDSLRMPCDGTRGLLVYNNIMPIGSYSEGKSKQICIMKGIPLDFFRYIAAHELAHEWMHENLPHLMDKPEIKEGFSEYVGWSLSKAENLKRPIKFIEKRDDDVYGAGFKKVREMMGDAKKANEWKNILLKEYPVGKSQKAGKESDKNQRTKQTKKKDK